MNLSNSHPSTYSTETLSLSLSFFRGEQRRGAFIMSISSETSISTGHRATHLAGSQISHGDLVFLLPPPHQNFCRRKNRSALPPQQKNNRSFWILRLFRVTSALSAAVELHVGKNLFPPSWYKSLHVYQPTSALSILQMHVCLVNRVPWKPFPIIPNTASRGAPLRSTELVGICLKLKHFLILGNLNEQ